jgi:hypothetical protein
MSSQAVRDLVSSYDNLSLSQKRILSRSRGVISEHLKSLPESQVAEKIDFEVWGQKFCELMVRLRFPLSFS